MSPEPPVDPGRSGFVFSTPEEPRRGFIKKFLAIIIGGIVGLLPPVIGLTAFLNPLRKSVKEKQSPSGSDPEGYFDVAALDSLTETPQVFKITGDRKDAWNTFPREAIGTVFLSRAGTADVRAFSIQCPHLGCSVDYRASTSDYHCPCHNSSFALDGKRSANSPSPRDLDSLDVKVNIDGRILVKFQNFKTGKEKKPV